MMPFDEWEDYQAGFYRTAGSSDYVAAAVAVLSDPDQFREAALEMLREWPVAARQNLEHMESGRNAWLGQATCCYVVGASSADTRKAWGMLTDAQRCAANAVAGAVREQWERGMRDAQAAFDL